MHTTITRALLPAAALLSAHLAAQQHLVVPPAYATTDAISFNWIAGASREVRQQTLIDASHLSAMTGSALQAIELRRTAKNQVYIGGSTNMVVTLSIAPHGPLECSSTFANNTGTSQVQVFNGTVTIPTSPPVTGTTVNWTTDNIVRIPFTTPFLYNGGTLCIDITGTPIPGMEANWWMADAEFEDLPGTTTTVGPGCGTYGGPTGAWSHVQSRSLVAGGYVKMFAYGTPNGLAVAAIGQKNIIGTPLTLLGFNSPTGCNLYLSTLDLLEARLFLPDTDPNLVSRGGRADVEIKMPAIPAALGFAMTTQWLDFTQVASSNAIEWTIAPALPTLNMALVEGHPLETQGNVTVHIAHVLRFEYQ